MCLMAPLPLRRASFARGLRVPALVSFWPTPWLHLQIAPCSSTLTQHDSATRLSVSMTRLPRCVDRRSSILQMSSVSFSCTQAATASESPSIIMMPSSSCNETPTPIHFGRVRSARFAFPLARLHSSQANAMPGRSDARNASIADTLWLAFCPSGSSASWSSGAFGFTPPGLACGRAA